MNYRDQWVTNEQGEKFIFTVEMQRKLDRLGLPVEPASLSQLEQVIEDEPARDESNQYESRRQDYRDRDDRSRGYRDRDDRNRDSRDRDDRGGETAVSSDDGPKETFEEPPTIQIDPMTGKYIGRMKWYNLKKGYGFIVRGAGEEIFFHKTGTVGEPTDLKEGQWILYDVEDTHKGPEATEVEPYEGDPELLG
jgi:cold shock CspA family protein